MTEFNKYMKRALNEAIMHDNPNYLAAVERGDILTPAENLSAKYSVKTGIPKVLYAIRKKVGNTKILTLVNETEAKASQYHWKIVKNPTHAELNQMTLSSEARAIIFKGNIYIGSLNCVHEQILMILQLADPELITTKLNHYDIRKENYSCWQFLNGNNTLQLSESYARIYEQIEYPNPDMTEADYRITQNLETLLLESIKTLPGNIQAMYDFELIVIGTNDSLWTSNQAYD